MAAWVEEDSVGITGLYGPVVDEFLLANVYDLGWWTEQYIFEEVVAGFEESERKTSDVCRKVCARARSISHCGAPRDVGDVCLGSSECVLGRAVGLCATVSAVLLSQKGSECRSCVVARNTIYFEFVAENCLVTQCHVLKLWICAKHLENCT